MNTANTIPYLVQEALKFDFQTLWALLGFGLLFVGACCATLFSVVKRGAYPSFVAIVSAWVALLTAFVGFRTGMMESKFLFSDMMVIDFTGNVFQILFCATAFLTIIVSHRYLKRETLHYAEYYVLVLFGALGMMLLVAATDLVVLFIALEVMSLAIYALVAFRRADRRSNEGSLKYFILGSVASAVLLYGSSLIYGATGSTAYPQILAFVTQDGFKSSLFIAGALLVSVGFFFKVASVPFHMWMPDVYEGAPLPVTAFMATGVKAASFAAFLRFLSFAPGLAQGPLHELFWWFAVISMFVGNMVALTQHNLKRLFAYSSIAHTGYLMMGLLAPSLADSGALTLYLIIYTASTFGAFVCLMLLSGRGDSRVMISDLEGLAHKKPWVAAAFSIFALSMAGIPPTAGFVGKYVLFYEVMKAKEISILILAVLSSAIGVYVYLRLLVSMYMRSSKTEALENTKQGSLYTGWIAGTVVITACLVWVLQAGLMPERLIKFVRAKSSDTTQKVSLTQ